MRKEREEEEEINRKMKEKKEKQVTTSLQKPYPKNTIITLQLILQILLLACTEQPTACIPNQLIVIGNIKSHVW